jgi:hemerythrin-like domain-containing protein
MSVKKSARPARAAVPALPPLEALEATHHKVMLVLQDFATLLARLDSHGVDATAQKLAADIGKFFSKEARKHHADEDDIVFPNLLNSGNEELVHHVQRLQQDHGWLEEDWVELGPQLDAMSKGYSWYDLDALKQGVEVFTQLYHEHIALEESLIYPAARKREAELAEQAALRVAQAAAEA